MTGFEWNLRLESESIKFVMHCVISMKCDRKVKNPYQPNFQICDSESLNEFKWSIDLYDNLLHRHSAESKFQAIGFIILAPESMQNILI